MFSFGIFLVLRFEAAVLGIALSSRCFIYVYEYVFIMKS